MLEGLNLIEAHTLFSRDDIIVLVPNWVNAVKPNPKDGVVVGPNTLQTLIRWLKSLQPKRIVVATGSGGGDTKEVMKKVGYDKILVEEMIELIDFNQGPYDELIINSSVIKKLKVNKILNAKRSLYLLHSLSSMKRQQCQHLLKTSCLLFLQLKSMVLKKDQVSMMIYMTSSLQWLIKSRSTYL